MCSVTPPGRVSGNEARGVGVLLAPLEKEVSFETEPGGDTMELFAYLDEHNRELQSAIAALRNHPGSTRPLLENAPTAEPEI